MKLMLSYAFLFNQPLNTWNVANAKDMSDMFLKQLASINHWIIAVKFNQRYQHEEHVLGSIPFQSTRVSYEDALTNK